MHCENVGLRIVQTLGSLCISLGSKTFLDLLVFFLFLTPFFSVKPLYPSFGVDGPNSVR